MKKLFLVALSCAFMTGCASFKGNEKPDQRVDYQEFTLDNGLHVVLHKDTSAPVVVTSVMYHVGSKNEVSNRTGFAHFFEHLLFEGTENIDRGEWFKIVTSNGGKNNANTSEDRTYYYEVFPSNNLELGLWMESERMLQPVINQIGVDTQNEVVKEEKRLRVDNQPYGRLIEEVKKNLFTKHPYNWVPIGSMEHLDASTLEEFRAFNKKFYVPNNAVLVVAGDIEYAKATALINKYFGVVKRGADVPAVNVKEDPITSPIKAVAEDANIQLPMYITAYRTPSMKTRDARVLDMISSYLSGGKSAPMIKEIVDEKKMALQLFAFNYSQEDYGSYIIAGIPMGETTREQLQVEIDNQIKKIQTNLISERDYQKLQNELENNYVNKNSNLEGLAENLATNYLLYGDITLINKEIDIYRSITREEIREVAKKYLKPNARLMLDYVPVKDNAKK